MFHPSAVALSSGSRPRNSVHRPPVSTPACIILAAMEPKPSPRRYSGLDRELEIYQLGLQGKPTPIPIPLALLEQRAKEILTPRAYDYVAGGAGGEQTMRAN